MKIALLGYGKMGKQIEEIAIERDHQICAKIRSSKELNELNFKNIDVAIDFSQPTSAIANIKHCIKNNTPIIVGTTGWYDQLPDIKKYCINNNGSMLFASNFSIGVNILFHLNKQLANIMNEYVNYNVLLTEKHHIHKLDEPSGTAITLANEITKAIDRKKLWKLNTSKNEELNIISQREGEVIGDHTVNYESEIDQITISHHAKNRKGFALGAVIAAEWLQNKKGFFSFNDMLKF